jgi:hypothetical protein
MKSTKKTNIKLPLIIAIVISILFIVITYIIIYNHKPIIERFEEEEESIGQYDYMAPVTENISDELWHILINKMKAVGVTELFSLDEIKSTYTNFVSKAEISYYLDNGMFPWNPYVTKLFTDFISNITQPQLGSTDDLVKQNMKDFPNRYAYSQYLLLPDMKESITGDAYLIYSGDKVLPSTTSAT